MATVGASLANWAVVENENDVRVSGAERASLAGRGRGDEGCIWMDVGDLDCCQWQLECDGYELAKKHDCYEHD